MLTTWLLTIDLNQGTYTWSIRSFCLKNAFTFTRKSLIDCAISANPVFRDVLIIVGGEVEMVEYIFKSLRVPVYIIIYMCTQGVYNYYPTISTISTHMRHKWQDPISFTNFWLGSGLLSNRKIAKSINLLSFIYQTCSNKSLDIYAVFVSKTWKFCDRDWQTDKTPMYKGFAVFLKTVKTDRRLTAHKL